MRLADKNLFQGRISLHGLNISCTLELSQHIGGKDFKSIHLNFKVFYLFLEAEYHDWNQHW